MSRRDPAASPFRDLSNLRTPRPAPAPASKAPLQAPTPTPLRRRGAPGPTPRDRSRLRALELDQSRSARRAESDGRRALRAFAASASSWLSLLLRDPAACGCGSAPAAAAAQPRGAAGGGGKRGEPGGERARGRSPKRRRGGDRGGELGRKVMTPAMAAALRDSLREACSLEDVTERMGKYMSKDACDEVLLMMSLVCKNIDAGRLKMKADCPLVTDLRIKERATSSFMCYNPDWLRIGFYIVLGGDALLQNGPRKQDKEVQFLRLILEKQMFSQSSAHKRVIEGHHPQGCREALGNIILKRIFLFVAALDRAKLESALPQETGIDGLDGGSPLLFCRQYQIKSSRHIIQECLAEAMHGEGDLLTHLATMGYKLSYQQPALSEYDFTIRSLLDDLQDGVILCRVIQLLLSDTSIILKVIAPPDTNKKKLHNCTMAIQYIKQAGIPLSDSDDVTISAEDIATGDEELILSLLWNMFIYMQLPLLANTSSLVRELTRLTIPVMEQQISQNKSHVGLLYNWVQAVCSKYGMSVKSSSELDSRTLNCLVKHYLNIDIFPLKETGCQKKLFTCNEFDTLTDIASCPSSKMGKVFADFLQDIPASGVLADDVLCDEKSATLLLAFLSSHLTNQKRLDQLKNLINPRLDYHQAFQCHRFQLAAALIQRMVRGWLARKRLLGSSSLRTYTKLCVLDHSQHRKCHQSLELKIVLHSGIRLQRWWRKFLLHQSLRVSVILIQSYVRGQLVQKHLHRTLCCINIIQRWWRKVVFLQARKRAAIIIQSHFRGWIARQAAARTTKSIISMQSYVHGQLVQKQLNRTLCCINIIQRWWRKVVFLQARKRAAIIIQSHFRGWIARQAAARTTKRIISMQSYVRGQLVQKQLNRTLCCINIIQRWWRKVVFLQSRKRAVIIIQSHFRGWIARQAAARTIKCITTVQSYVKAYLVRKASKQEIALIRSRLQNSSTNVDDSMRLMNRLVAALSQLLHCQRISSIRQTCATFNTATEYSKKCCETLVAEGAVGILLQQIHSLNRGVADQEVLKQVLLTFRNIVRYPNLRTVLINTPKSVETIFQLLLRDKDEFFIASDILKKLCESKEGHETTRALHLHIRRLHSLVQDLEKKVELDKRNGRAGAGRENNLRRFREATTLHHLLISDY